ncbi:MAG: 6,7-dimethyl-8-ribityllumazine synthase, partial [Candidatus Paceibacteria bacterium]
MGKQAEFEQILDGSHLRVGVVRARWNGEVTESLSQAARTTLTECGVDTNQILETSVPGSFE